MTSPSKTELKAPSSAAIFWDARHGRGTGDSYGESALTLLVIAVMFGLLSIVFNAKPVHSQGVQLIKVDIAVVAKGLRASKLIGTGVTNEKNEKIGTLDDIVIAPGRALFGVLQVGGFLGIGAHLVAVPYESLVIDEAGKKIELPGASKEELKKLAEFKYRA